MGNLADGMGLRMRDNLTPEQKRAHRYRVAAADFRSAIEFAEHLLEKSWHKNEWHLRGKAYMHQTAYVTAFIVTYMRPFTASQEPNWPAFPIKPAGLSEDEKSLHKRLKVLRNEVYAHTDSVHHDYQPMVIRGAQSALISRPQFRLTQEELVLAIGMLRRFISVAQSSEA